MECFHLTTEDVVDRQWPEFIFNTNKGEISCHKKKVIKVHKADSANKARDNRDKAKADSRTEEDNKVKENKVKSKPRVGKARLGAQVRQRRAAIDTSCQYYAVKNKRLCSARSLFSHIDKCSVSKESHMPTRKTKSTSKGTSTTTKKAPVKKASTAKKKTPAKKTSTSKAPAAKKKTPTKRASTAKQKTSNRKTSSRKPARKGIVAKTKDVVSDAAGAIGTAAKTGLQIGTAAAAATLVEEATDKSRTSSGGGSNK